MLYRLSNLTLRRLFGYNYLYAKVKQFSLRFLGFFSGPGFSGCWGDW